MKAHHILTLALATFAGAATASELVSPWSEGKPETKSRLLGGTLAGKPMAAVEIALAEGWKPYWRFPGDAGGVPPTFDWATSDNVASVKVLYPAPARLTDKAGDTLGYKTAVVFPVVIEPKDPAKPVSLKLKLEYGVCRDVCVPVESELGIDLKPGEPSTLPASVTAAIDRVPRGADVRRAGDPKLLKTEVKLEGANPSLAFEAEFPGGTAKVDAFVESPNGYYIPLPKAGSGKDVGKDRLRFEIDLTGAVDPADIKGKSAIVTLVSPQGQSETIIKLD
jgi:DsbC/DsbD-like thiol-disulfide interchange protein